MVWARLAVLPDGRQVEWRSLPAKHELALGSSVHRYRICGQAQEPLYFDSVADAAAYLAGTGDCAAPETPHHGPAPPSVPEQRSAAPGRAALADEVPPPAVGPGLELMIPTLVLPTRNPGEECSLGACAGIGAKTERQLRLLRQARDHLLSLEHPALADLRALTSLELAITELERGHSAGSDR